MYLTIIHIYIYRPSGEKTYVYNPKFKFKKIRVPLNVTVKSEQQAENEETRKAIENDRSFLIQVSYFFFKYICIIYVILY